MKWVIAISLGGMICVKFMNIVSDDQEILRYLAMKFEILYCWHYAREGFTNYVLEMGSDAVIYVPSFIKIGFGI
jgi:hypothetical protein